VPGAVRAIQFRLLNHVPREADREMTRKPTGLQDIMEDCRLESVAPQVALGVGFRHRNVIAAT
jgi:hypothetical protein